MLPPSAKPVPGLPPPAIRLPEAYRPTPYPYAALTRYIGRVQDRIVGAILFALTIIGAGNAVWGIANFLTGVGALSWWRSTSYV